MENTTKKFEDLITIGRVTKSLTIGKRTIVLGTLDSETQAQLLDLLPEGSSDNKKLEEFQRQVLIGALESIDGEILTNEEKTLLFRKAQPPFVAMLFSEYENLITEQNKVFDDVKKNILAPKKTP